MAETTDDIKQRIIDEQQKIHVDSYTDIAFEGAWKGRARGLWATATLGTLTGLAIGAIAPIFPALVMGAIPAAGLWAGSVAIFSAMGLGSGFTIGIIVGTTSGSVASVAKEQDRRQKGQEIAQVLSTEPSASITQPRVPDEAITPYSSPNLFKRIMDDYVNVPALFSFATIGAIGGVVMFAAFAAMLPGGLPALGATLATGAMGSGAGGALPLAGSLITTLIGADAAASTAAVAAYSVGVMACFGSLFGCNYPKMSSDMQRYFGNMLGGQLFGTEKGPSAEQLRRPVFAQVVNLPEHTTAADVSRKNPRVAYQDLIKSGRMGVDSPDMIVRG